MNVECQVEKTLISDTKFMRQPTVDFLRVSELSKMFHDCRLRESKLFCQFSRGLAVVFFKKFHQAVIIELRWLSRAGSVIKVKV
uniref:Uncharacterized protein n=1 Tax=Acrobeloides nanus TaxID=290746 RepID=A0A914D1G4_9BILA